MPAAPAQPFTWVASSGPVAFDQPTRALITRLEGFTPPTSFATLATFLQTVLRNTFDNGASVTTANRGLVFNTGSDLWSLQLPSDAELRSATWRAANWPAGTPYDPSAPAAYNASLRIASPSAMARQVTVRRCRARSTRAGCSCRPRSTPPARSWPARCRPTSCPPSP